MSCCGRDVRAPSESHEGGFEVGAHDAGYAAGFGGVPEVVDGEFLFAPAGAEGFEGEFEAEFVPIFETVGDGAGGGGDADGGAFDGEGLDAVLQGGAGEADDADSGLFDDGSPGFAVEGEPDLVGGLRGEAVEAEGGVEAEDGLGDELGDGGDVVLRGGGVVGEGVEAAAFPDEEALLGEGVEEAGLKADGFEVARADEGSDAEEAGEGGWEFGHRV